MKKLTLLFFLFQLFCVFSQNIPSKPKQTIDSLLKLSKDGIIEVNLKSTLVHGFLALKKSKHQNYSEGVARANYYIANSLFAAGEYKNALEFLSDAIKEDYAQSNPTLLSDIYRVQGRIYGNLQMNQLAIREFKKGFEASEKVVIESHKQYLQNLFYENMSHIYFRMDKIDSARYFLDKNEELFKSQKEDFIFNNKINYYTSLAEFHLKKKQNDSAIISLQEALNLADKYQYPYKSTIYKTWGDVYQNETQLDSAIFYYKKAVENIKETAIESELPAVYERLVQIYKDLNDDKSFQHYSIKLINTKEKLLQQKMEASDTAIKILLDETKKENAQRNYLLLAILTLFTLILFGATIYLIRNYKKAKIRMANKRQIIAEKDKIIHQIEEETIQLKQQVNEAFDEVIQLAKDNHPEFILRFSEVYPQQYEKILSLQPKLLHAEIKFCAMLYLQFSTKDIAEYTFVTVKAVQHRKFRMRKKLNIPSDADILDWLNIH